MKDLKSRLLENPDESVRVGFGSEEFNDLPLIQENPHGEESQVGKNGGANVEVRQSPLVRRRHHEPMQKIEYAESEGSVENRPSKIGNSS